MGSPHPVLSCPDRELRGLLPGVTTASLLRSDDPTEDAKGFITSLGDEGYTAHLTPRPVASAGANPDTIFLVTSNAFPGIAVAFGQHVP
jgi:hypothetical protein